MKYTKEQLRLWMSTAAAVNGHGFGKMQNGRFCIYRRTGKAPTRKDIILTEAQFVKDMNRGWH